MSRYVFFLKEKREFPECGLDVSRVIVKTIEECTSIMYIAMSAIRYR